MLISANLMVEISSARKIAASRRKAVETQPLDILMSLNTHPHSKWRHYTDNMHITRVHQNDIEG